MKIHRYQNEFEKYTTISFIQEIKKNKDTGKLKQKNRKIIYHAYTNQKMMGTTLIADMVAFKANRKTETIKIIKSVPSLKQRGLSSRDIITFKFIYILIKCYNL